MPRPPSGPAAAGEAFFQFSLWGLAATGYLAVLATGRLDWPTALLAALGLAGRLLILRGWMGVPLSAGGVRLATLAYIGFYPMDVVYVSGSFLAATVRMVFFLAVVKLLTAQTGRDYLYLGILALLELLAAAVLSSSPAFLAFLVLFLALAVAARTGYEIHASAREARLRAPAGRLGWRLAAVAATLVLGTLVFGAALFVVVPRAAGAWLSRLGSPDDSVAGFSEQVSLEGVGRIEQSSSPVLRVKILEGRAGPALKWRGGALQHFDGLRWSNPAARPELLESRRGYYMVARSRELPRSSARLRYRARRLPLDSEALFLAGIPEFLSGDFQRLEVTPSGVISLPGSRWRSVVYEGTSLVDPTRPAELRTLSAEGPYPARVQANFLQLPEIDPRIRKLTRYLTEAQLSPYWRSAAIEHYLRTELGYTLELPAEQSLDPLAEFLFRRRKGHCEYFASAMTVMLRCIGIPARVATGFQGGIYNPVSHSYTVRASDAHAWVEGYMPGFGWVSFDPTPSQPAPAQGGPFHQAWLLADALETWWNEWIVQYDLARQVQLARSVQERWYQTSYEAVAGFDRAWRAARRWVTRMEENPAPVLAWLALLPAAGLALWGALGLARRARSWLVAAAAARRARRGDATARDCALLYSRALSRAGRRGFRRHASQTPREISLAAGSALFQQITDTYNRARFGEDPEARRRLPALVRSLETGGW